MTDDSDVDVSKAFAAYLERFEEEFGPRPDGAFVKFGKHLVQKLSVAAFEDRLQRYLLMHETTQRMIQSGSTINDAVVLEFEESAAWIALHTPDVMQLFRGEMGDPNVAKGNAKPQ